MRHRITPADAGKTSFLGGDEDEIRDHPRLRGENTVTFGINYQSQGSPPPTRGKRAKTLMFLSLLGITPAYAGKTLRRTL